MKLVDVFWIACMGLATLKHLQIAKQFQKLEQLHLFQEPQNLFTNIVINSHEKSNTHNFHNVFIYNIQLLDPNPFLQVLFLLVLYFIMSFS
jgi:hypothetical protein